MGSFKVCILFEDGSTLESNKAKPISAPSSFEAAKIGFSNIAIDCPFITIGLATMQDLADVKSVLVFDQEKTCDDFDLLEMFEQFTEAELTA